MDVRFETLHGNKAGKHEWLTPKEIIDILGEFVLNYNNYVTTDISVTRANNYRLDNTL